MLGIVAAAAATWLSGAGSAVYHDIFPQPAVLASTNVRYFHILDLLSNRILLRIVGHDYGTCLEGSSVADPGAGLEASRCFGRRLISGHNLIYDPCFKSTTNGQDDCVTAPWATSAVAFAVSLSEAYLGPLPSEGIPRARPWALELGNGDRCGANTGAAGAIAGQPVSYFCNHGIAVGPPDRSKVIWTIAYGSANEDATNATQIRVAWY